MRNNWVPPKNDMIVVQLNNLGLIHLFQMFVNKCSIAVSVLRLYHLTDISMKKKFIPASFSEKDITSIEIANAYSILIIIVIYRVAHAIL
jgi:hypothetical protein